MRSEQFWQLIEQTDDPAPGPGGHADAIMRRVGELTDRELAGFAAHWHAHAGHADRRSLWQAVTVAFGPFGDDSFSDVRAWLVCQGRDIYARVLADPDRILQHLGPDGDEDFVLGELVGTAIRELLDDRQVVPHADGGVALPDSPPDGEIDLTDAAAVHAHFPRCAAHREAYLATSLPAIEVPADPGGGQARGDRLRAHGLWQRHPGGGTGGITDR